MSKRVTCKDCINSAEQAYFDQYACKARPPVAGESGFSYGAPIDSIPIWPIVSGNSYCMAGVAKKEAPPKPANSAMPAWVDKTLYAIGGLAILGIFVIKGCAQ